MPPSSQGFIPSQSFLLFREMSTFKYFLQAMTEADLDDELKLKCIEVYDKACINIIQNTDKFINISFKIRRFKKEREFESYFVEKFVAWRDFKLFQCGRVRIIIYKPPIPKGFQMVSFTSPYIIKTRRVLSLKPKGKSIKEAKRKFPENDPSIFSVKPGKKVNKVPSNPIRTWHLPMPYNEKLKLAKDREEVQDITEAHSNSSKVDIIKDRYRKVPRPYPFVYIKPKKRNILDVKKIGLYEVYRRKYSVKLLLQDSRLAHLARAAGLTLNLKGHNVKVKDAVRDSVPKLSIHIGQSTLKLSPEDVNEENIPGKEIEPSEEKVNVDKVEKSQDFVNNCHVEDININLQDYLNFKDTDETSHKPTGTNKSGVGQEKKTFVFGSVMRRSKDVASEERDPNSETVAKSKCKTKPNILSLIKGSSSGINTPTCYSPASPSTPQLSPVHPPFVEDSDARCGSDQTIESASSMADTVASTLTSSSTSQELVKSSSCQKQNTYEESKKQKSTNKLSLLTVQGVDTADLPHKLDENMTKDVTINEISGSFDRIDPSTTKTSMRADDQHQHRRVFNHSFIKRVNDEHQRKDLETVREAESVEFEKSQQKAKICTESMNTTTDEKVIRRISESENSDKILIPEQWMGKNRISRVKNGQTINRNYQKSMHQELDAKELADKLIDLKADLFLSDEDEGGPDDKEDISKLECLMLKERKLSVPVSSHRKAVEIKEVTETVSTRGDEVPISNNCSKISVKKTNFNEKKSLKMFYQKQEDKEDNCQKEASESSERRSRKQKKPKSKSRERSKEKKRKNIHKKSKKVHKEKQEELLLNANTDNLTKKCNEIKPNKRYSKKVENEQRTKHQNQNEEREDEQCHRKAGEFEEVTKIVSTKEDEVPNSNICSKLNAKRTDFDDKERKNMLDPNQDDTKKDDFHTRKNYIQDRNQASEESQWLDQSGNQKEASEPFERGCGKQKKSKSKSRERSKEKKRKNKHKKSKKVHKDRQEELSLDSNTEKLKKKSKKKMSNKSRSNEIKAERRNEHQNQNENREDEQCHSLLNGHESKVGPSRSDEAQQPVQRKKKVASCEFCGATLCKSNMGRHMKHHKSNFDHMNDAEYEAQTLDAEVKRTECVICRRLVSHYKIHMSCHTQ